MSTPTCEGLRAAWVEQQARERARRCVPDSITARDADGAAFDTWAEWMGVTQACGY
ncbi:MAG: hypothetical protein L0I17_07920 [Actinomycetia bacterium]|nr:hypothetical protein [Actinomycetes bacterium]